MYEEMSSFLVGYDVPSVVMGLVLGCIFVFDISFFIFGLSVIKWVIKSIYCLIRSRKSSAPADENKKC